MSLNCDSSGATIFEMHTVTTRYCDLDGVWSGFDLSNCTVKNESLVFLLSWFVVENEGNNTTEETVRSQVELEVYEI